MTKVKGAAIKTLPLFIKEKFGQEQYDRWFEALSEQAKETYSSIILAGSWYSVQTAIVEPTLLIAEMFYGGDIIKAAKESGAFSAEYALKGIYKAFVKVSSIHFLIKKGSSIFSTFFDPAYLEVSEEKKNKMTVQIKDFPDINEVIEYRILGWMEKGLEIGGCKGVSSEKLKSITNGSDVTELVFVWNGERKRF